MASSTTDRWSARIMRARERASRHPEARDPLGFLARLMTMQATLAARHHTADAALPECLEWIAVHGPDSLALAANDLAGAQADWQSLVDGYETDRADSIASVVVEVLLQVFPPASCPSCSKPPTVSLLREAGHGSRRSFVCGVCLSERPAPRLGCVACGESRVDALPVYRSEDDELARIDACDTCRAYIKTLDLTRDASACPIADDIASIALDLWARERCYRRIRPNLLRL
jgi:FdhE protein